MGVPVPLESVRSYGKIPPAAQRQQPGATGVPGAEGATAEGLKDLRKKWAKGQPSEGVDPAKARQILKDGEANGTPLTDKQRGMFGAAAGRDGKGLETNGRERASVEGTEERHTAKMGKTDMSNTGGISGAGNKGLEETKPSEVALGGVDGGGEGDEPVSSQIMRRWHQDNSILLEDYDKLNHHLEHAPTKKSFEKKLSGLAHEMDWLEDHHKTHHPDLPRLGKDEEEAGGAVGADSEPKFQEEQETEGSADDNLEGMDMKDLRGFYVKSIRDYYRAKRLGTKGVAPPGQGPPPGDEEFQRKPGAQNVDPGGNTDLGEEEHQPPPGVPAGPGADPAMGTDLGEEEQQAPPGAEAATLPPHHKAVVSRAYKYLKELESADKFTRGHQMDAYHHAKAMEEAVGEVGNASARAGGGVPPLEEEHMANAKGLGRGKTKGFPEEDAAAGEVGVTEPAGNETYKRMKSAAGLLNDIANADDLTEVHRGKIKEMSGMMAPLAEEEGVAEVPAAGIGEKNLGRVIQGQKDSVKKLQNVMTNLLSRFN